MTRYGGLIRVRFYDLEASKHEPGEAPNGGRGYLGDFCVDAVPRMGDRVQFTMNEDVTEENVSYKVVDVTYEIYLVKAAKLITPSVQVILSSPIVKEGRPARERAERIRNADSGVRTVVRGDDGKDILRNEDEDETVEQ